MKEAKFEGATSVIPGSLAYLKVRRHQQSFNLLAKQDVASHGIFPKDSQ